MNESSDDVAELVPINSIRVETALSRYPVHRLARKGSIKIEVSDGSIRSGSQTKWEVSYNSEFGQPGPLAYKLDTLIVNRRIEEARRPVPRILKLGSLSDLCRELELSDSGTNRSNIKESLYQNASSFIKTKTRYRRVDGSEKTLETGFTRYSVVFTGEELPDGRKADGVYVILNDVFIEVINGAMTRPLDYDYLKQLSPAPQRFYELLSYKMYSAMKYDKLCAKLTYSELCAHAPQTRHDDRRKMRSQMDKVHKPHRDSGYIARIEYQESTSDDGHRDWIMLYQPGPKARAEYRGFARRGGPNLLEIEPIDAVHTKQEDAPSELERQLIDRGVTARTAAEIARDHEEERITAQIERVDWLAAKKSDKIDDPAAYLVSAIRNDYAAPKGFVSAAERQRRKEAKAAKDSTDAKASRKQREEEDISRAERGAIAAYRQKLTTAEIAKHEATILDRLDDAARSTYDQAMPAVKGMMLSSWMNDHIRQILRDRQTSLSL